MTEIKSKDKSVMGRYWKKISVVWSSVFGSKDSENPAQKRTILSRIGGIILESFSVVLTLSLIWFAALGYLMNRKSVDLAFFKPHYEQWFSEAFDGRSTDIEKYKARWVQKNRAIEVTAENIDIVGQDKAEQNIELVKGQFVFGESLMAQPSLQSLSIDGGALTIARSEEGGVRLGLGTPQTFERVAPLWSSDANTDANDGNAEMLQALRTISVSNATVYVQDAVTGLDLILTELDGDFEFDGTFLDIISEGNLVASDQVSPFELHLKTTLDRRDFVANLAIDDLNPIHISPKSGRLALVGNLDALVDLDVDLSVLPESGFQDLSVKFSAGDGLLKTGRTYKPFQSAVINAAYNVEDENVQITDLTIRSLALNVDAEGELNDIGTPESGFLSTPFGYAVELGKLRLNPGKNFDGPINIQSGLLAGRIDLKNRIYEFDDVDLDFGDYQTDLSGRLEQGDKTVFKTIAATGEINGTLSPEQLLGFWPNKFALGARNWIENSIKTATLSNLVLTVSVDEGDLLRKAIDNEHINLSFDVTDANVQYMKKMPWLRDAAGRGVLHGNSLDFVLESGHVDNFSIPSGVVNIPRLSPKGGDFTIDLEGQGTAEEMMRITNNPPFEFANQFGINPADLGGEGKVFLKVTRPLREFFDRSLIRYDLAGNFQNVTLPVGIGKYRLNGGNLDLTANGTGIVIDGPIKVGEWNSYLHWDKKLGVESVPASYSLIGKINRDDLDNFGIGLRRHFGGEIDLKVSGDGDGLAVQKVILDADFEDADLNIGTLWQKQKGDPGTVQGRLEMTENVGAKLDEIVIKAPGMDITGSVSIASDFKLNNLDVKSAKIDGFIDAAVQAKPTEDGVLSTFLTGEYLNVEPWVDKAFRSQSSAVTAPIRLTASVNKLALNENYEVSDAAALFSHDGIATQQARLKGQTSNGPVSAEITSDFENGNRKIFMQVPDAGSAMRTLLGLDSIKEGALTINGTLPPTGEAGGVKGQIKLTDFTLVRAPAFAQILSLASLTGLADTLGGAGLGFSELDAQFSLENGMLKVRDGRASGPALGLTMEGDVGITNKTMDMNGVLVPSYSVNSVLGDIPLIGDIVVGKKGEGMFALNYSIKGPFSATQVSVNPLSALTPGFLRRIFDVNREDIDDTDVKDLIEKQKQDG